MKYAIQLDKKMRERGVKGVDLVRITGRTHANISRIRRGRIRSIRLDMLFTICDVLDCEPKDILIRLSDEEAEHLEKGVYILQH